MKVSAVDWDDANRQHLFVDNAEREISEEEIDEVLYQTFSRARLSKAMVTNGEERRIVWGRTFEGRCLKVIVKPLSNDVLRPITAWDMSDADVASYEAWHRTVKP